MHLRATRVLITLLVIDAVLVLGYIMTRSFESTPGTLRLLFNMNSEGNFPTWFSGTQLVAIALAAGLRASKLRRERRHWRIYAVAALGFLFLSIDEGAMVHERLSLVAKSHGLMAGSYLGDNSDLIVAIGYMAVGITILFFMRRDIRAFITDGPGTALIIVGCISFVVGAVFVDNFYFLTGTMQSALEDALELAGGSLILAGFLSKLEGTTTIRVAPVGSPAEEGAPSMHGVAPAVARP